MKFMNTYEIDDALERHGSDPVLGRAVRVLASLRDLADASSDGWWYWPKPARAAAKLMEAIERGSPFAPFGTVKPTDADVSAALRPIKAFLSRHTGELNAVALSRTLAVLAGTEAPIDPRRNCSSIKAPDSRSDDAATITELRAALEAFRTAVAPIRAGERNGAAFGMLSIADDAARAVLAKTVQS